MNKLENPNLHINIDFYIDNAIKIRIRDLIPYIYFVLIIVLLTIMIGQAMAFEVLLTIICFHNAC